MGFLTQPTPKFNCNWPSHLLTWVCLCAFVLIPHEQVTLSSAAAECECPCHEDGERAEQELVVSSAAQKRLTHRRHYWLDRSHDSVTQTAQKNSCTTLKGVRLGHQFANGLGAPMLI